MKVQTKFFGEIEVNEEKIITLSEGMLGFEKNKKFVLIPHQKDNMFKWFQSIEDPLICFLVIEPVLFMFNYSLEISDDTVSKLKIQTPEEAIIYALVVIPEDPMKISANLAGPIVINTRNRNGVQVVSNNPDHQIKHYIIEELKSNAAKLMTNFAAAISGKVAASVETLTTNAPESKE